MAKPKLRMPSDPEGQNGERAEWARVGIEAGGFLMKNQTVTVADLKDGILHPKYAGRFLLCRVCGERFSANKGDYFTLSEDYVFTHCAKNMKLVTEKTVYTEVRL